MENTQRSEDANYPQRAFWLLVGVAEIQARPQTSLWHLSVCSAGAKFNPQI